MKTRYSFQDKQDVKPDFVEVNIGGEISREYIVEMENPNGNRMKIHFKGNIGNDLLGLAMAFWGE